MAEAEAVVPRGRRPRLQPRPEHRGGVELSLALTFVLALLLLAPCSAPAAGLDPSFGNGGIKAFDLGPGGDTVAALEIQEDEKFAIAGEVDLGPPGFAIARLTPGGAPDADFAGDGNTLTQFPDMERAGGTDIAIDSEGRIIVAGYVQDDGKWYYPFFIPAEQKIGVARYTPSGDLDASFSGDGLAVVSFYDLFGTPPPGTYTCCARAAVAVQDDDKVVVGGLAEPYGSCTDCADFGLARFKTDGSLDSSFSGDGRLKTDFPGPDANQAVTELAIDAAGRIVAIGESVRFSDFKVATAVARYTSAGALDNSFSDDGMVVDGRQPGYPSAHTFDGSGRIGIIGDRTDGEGSGADITRVNASGAADTSYGTSGVARIDHTGYLGAPAIEPEAATASASGEIVIALHGGSRSYAFRLTPSGKLDSAVQNSGANVFPAAVRLDGSDRVVVAGSSLNGNTPSVLMRYASLGEPPHESEESLELGVDVKTRQKAGKPIKLEVRTTQKATAVVKGRVVLRRDSRARAARSVKLGTERLELAPGRKAPVRLSPKGGRRKRERVLGTIKRQVKRGGKATAKIGVAAEDQSGRKATDNVKVRLFLR